MTSSVGLQAVIWDLGGVILRTEDRSARSAWETQLGLAEYELDRIVFGGEMGHKASLGQANARAVWESVGQQLQLGDATLRRLRRAFWQGDRLDRELLDFIRDLRPEHRTGLLSNAWPELRRDLVERWNMADAFDEIVISAEVGLAKPDPRIYELILDRFDIQPAAAVFVDDFEENVAAAAEIGMQAVHFKDPLQVMEDVSALLSH